MIDANVNSPGQVQLTPEGFTIAYGETFLECRQLIRKLGWYRSVKGIVFNHLSSEGGVKGICFRNTESNVCGFGQITRGLTR